LDFFELFANLAIDKDQQYDILLNVHRLLSQIIIVALLMLNIEGVSDLSGDLWETANGHGSEHTHEVHGDDIPVSPDIDSECDGSQDHCSHGHSASPVEQLTSVHSDEAYRFHIRTTDNLINHAQAPPTPPPNA
jgi:hypothetical protein